MCLYIITDVLINCKGNFIMNIEIHRLTPERLNDFLYFFENVAHTDNKKWDRCYCNNYCAAHNSHTLRKADMANPDVRRDFAIKYVNEGLMQGYLAYVDGNVIGWCNANTRNDCLHCFGWKYHIANWKIDRKSKDKIKSIFCFTIAPDMRGQGVATELLERVIDDAKKDGYKYVESYPNKENTDMYYNYVGPEELYRKLGFELYTETKWRLVLRKKL